jgi:hypothetical protein
MQRGVSFGDRGAFSMFIITICIFIGNDRDDVSSPMKRVTAAQTTLSFHFVGRFLIAIHIFPPSPNRIGVTCRTPWRNVGMPFHHRYSECENGKERNAESQS